MSKVVVANDHGAVELTARIVDYLRQRGFEVNYLGTAENKSVDYPDMAELACTEFKKGGYEFGVLCCGTGIGISISANKIKGIRCALPQNCFAAKMAKEHNAANFIAFGGRIDYQEDVLDMVAAYVDAEISQDERHARRRAKMMFLEN
ncbi:MAG: RpiB/LacA/LacB family sugar-phosphate isomerase [Spirochaetales bacterium]|nr:RpiB/LacA/LacB family sugar-phosphate isomerase [Spirochaetales bacterium]MBR1583509.1 RpiB/LacA/LacB family sugar-phosphate isomerase [Spirochaetales bacterium]MBR6085743.1 RpiB/LacA/LacB family sugar-phosphate isomerase [Spirochaetales bacterium]